MPINLDEALGAELPPAEFSWTSSDIQLYHLGLGAGHDPMDKRELRYLVDDTPQVLPTFGNVAQSFHMTEPPTVKFPGIDIELSRVLHASEAVSVPAPIPPSGTGRAVTQIHRHLGQGQGRGDLVGDDGHRARRRAVMDAEAVDLRPRRGRLRRRARSVDVVGAAASAHPTSNCPSRSLRSRRCCTGCAATATRCIRIRISLRQQGFRVRSCMGCAPTA